MAYMSSVKETSRRLCQERKRKRNVRLVVKKQHEANEKNVWLL